MTWGTIRTIAICIFRHKAAILVSEGYDPTKKETFYRPLGGGVDFGEYSHQTVRREIREEIGAEVANARYLGALENIFTYDGQPGHEIIFVYEAEFVDQAFYEQPWFSGYEDAGSEFKAMWQPLDYFQQGQAPLYPTGLLALLEGS